MEAVRASYDSISLESETNKKLVKEIKQRYMASYSTYIRGVSFVNEHVERLKANSLKHQKANEVLQIPQLAHI